MPDQPKWFENALTNLCGRNLYNEPKLQVRFAPYFRDHLGRPKYINPVKGGSLECWVLVRYAEPRFFGTPDAWETDRYFDDDINQVRVDRKGDYPHRGDFVMVCPLSNDGQYLELDQSVFNAIVNKIRADEAFAELQEQKRVEFITQQEDDKEVQAQAQREADDAVRDDYYKTNWGKINRKQGAGYSITPR